MDFIHEHADELVQPLRLIRHEQEAVYQALILCRGNVSLAAKRLGMRRTTLQSRLKKWEKGRA
jgi:transcriptional regulator of acetoin/glycerol metabolism